MKPRWHTEVAEMFSYLLRILSFFDACLIPGLVWVQQATATITGILLTPSHNAITGAKVEAKDVARGTVWTTESNLEGFYSLPRVSVGTYEVRVEMSGFQTEVNPPFELMLNQTKRLDFKM